MPVGENRPEADAVAATAQPMQNVGRALIRGTAWALVMRWAIKAIGMVSMLILARLLAPEDYGLMAMATLVVGLVEAFLNASAETALLRHPDPTPELAHSAWTMKLLQSIVIAFAVCAAAPAAVVYFREPRVAHVIWLLSLGFVFGGASSVGPVLARKDLNFGLEVRIGVYAKIISFFVTVGCAWWWRNYWALVAGTLAGQLSSCVLGYALHRYRPRFCVARVRELWGFSQWLLLSGIASYVSSKLDEFVAGRIGSSRDLGFYRIASEVGLMVSVELGAPMNRALLPVLATMQRDLPRMRSALMKTVAVVNTFTLPAGFGLALVASTAVPVLLGARWNGAVHLLQLFAMMGAVRFIVGPYYTLFMALGRSRLLAYMSWLDVCTFGIAAWPLVNHLGFTGLAVARLVAAAVAVVVWLILGHRAGLRVQLLFKAIWRPALGVCLMSVAETYLLAPHSPPGLLGLAMQVVGGAAIYSAWLALSWYCSGRPAGVEASVIGMLGNALGLKRS